MNKQFNKNWSTLKQKHPDLANRLRPELEIFKSSPQGNQEEYFEWKNSPSGYTNLYYKNHEFSGLYHSEEPFKEASESIQKANISQTQLVFVLGGGLGYILQTLIKKLPKHVHQVCVVEQNPQIFLRALSTLDLEEVLTHPKVSFLIERERITAQSGLGSFYEKNKTNCRRIKLVATPKALESSKVYYNSIAKAIANLRSEAVLAQGNSVEDSLIGLENILDNLPFALNNPGLTSLYDKFKGQTCISVAAGPSVNQHWETLKKLQGKVPIITCDTLLKPMSERGISPDIVTAIERVDIVTDFFRDVPVDQRSLLVGPQLLLRESIEAFQGETLLYAPFEILAKALGIDFLGSFQTGSSAGNLNLSLATIFGFKNIILVGHDLAFGHDTKSSHAAGTIHKKREESLSEEELQKKSGGRKVKTQDGETEVYTTLLWSLFRSQIVGLIGKYQDRNWINTSFKGASIQGTGLMSLEEALKHYHQEDLDFYEKRQELVPLVGKEEHEKRQEHCLKRQQEVLQSIDHWQEQGSKLHDKLIEWEEHIRNKENQGKPVSIAYLNDALDEVLRIKSKSVNYDINFAHSAMKILNPAHTAFESTINEMRHVYKDDYSLKRDFLLAHRQYFRIWNKWLPKIQDCIRQSIDRLKKEAA